ncbi:MAG: hypothetical protein H6737_19935 [Alphaproteobacteria bacterium]|nr:hypothetical protein [Alphaproteobacteria bacterium]
MFLVWSLAWASDCTEPLTEKELKSIVSAASAAVGNDDVAGFRGQYKELSRRVPCLAGPVPRASWAEMLVLDAIVRFAEGQDVSAPLGTARTVDPGVEVPPFLAEIETPTRKGGDSVPSGVELYLDGARVTRLPPLAGDHVVQRVVDGEWESTLSSSVPKSWTSSGPVKAIREPIELGTRWFYAGATPGVAWMRQHPEEPGDYLPEAKRLAVGVTVAGEARLWVDSVGAFTRGALALQVGRLSGGGLRLDPSVELGATVALGPVVGEAGAMASFTPLLEGGKNRQRLDLLPALGVRWLDDSFDAGLTVAGWLDSARVRARAGYSTDAGAGLLRIGLEVGGHSRGFEQQLPDRDRALRQTVLDAGLALGLVVR